MTKIHITASEKILLVSILQGDFQVIVFGSRVMGKNKKFSDLDICLKGKGPISDVLIGELREKLQESNLPFIVDLSDYFSLPGFLKKEVDEQGVPLEM